MGKGGEILHSLAESCVSCAFFSHRHSRHTFLDDLLSLSFCLAGCELHSHEVGCMPYVEERLDAGGVLGGLDRVSSC